MQVKGDVYSWGVYPDEVDYAGAVLVAEGGPGRVVADRPPIE